MLPEDLMQFQKNLRQQSGISFLPSILPKNEIQCVTSLLTPDGISHPNDLYLARDADLSAVVLRPVPQQRYWTIDDLHSPVVELSKSIFKDQTISRGRLYFKTGFFDSHGQWKEKPHEFIHWADGLLRWIRRNFIKDPTTGYYVGRSAWEAVTQGEYQLRSL